MTKRLRPTCKLHVRTCLTQLLDIIEKQFSCKSQFDQAFEKLVQKFTGQFLETPDKEYYMFVCNAKPFYEYANLCSFNAVCSYGKNLIGIDETFAYNW